MDEQNNSRENQLVFRTPKERALRLLLKIPHSNNPLSSVLLLGYGFILIILLGTILLVLPVSSASGHWTHPVDALFTATSAVSVTGLAVVDTGTYWNTSGQIILMVLIQIGGLGFIIGATFLLLAIGGRFGLKERLVISESMGLDQLGGVLGIVTKVALFVFLTEAAGAAILYIHWVSAGNTITPGLAAVFHTVSAFNNCGMDIFGNFSSLSAYRGDAVVLLVTALLILSGSTGYYVLADIAGHRRFSKLSFESKIVLTVTGSILVLGTLFYMVAEYSGPETLGPLSFSQKLMGAFFQSVANRTAGFSTFDIGALSQLSLFATIFQMYIGGAAGSVAGGVKVNTFGVLAITIMSIIRGKDNIEAFGRQITRQTVYRALTLLVLYLGAGGIVVTLLSITEIFPLEELLFETFSALGTVGLSTGITPDLSYGGRFIIIVTMFVGRLGPLALMAFLVRRKQPTVIEYPYELIRLG